MSDRNLPLVLVVDDSRDILQILAHVLEDVAVVSVAASLTAARLALAQHRYDLVVLDLLLPDGSGLDLLADIKAVRPEQRVVIHSGAATDRIVADALAFGADGVILKNGLADQILGYL